MAKRTEAVIGRALDRLHAAAQADLPKGVAVRREPGGLRLEAPGLLARWPGDTRLWGLATSAARGRP